MMVCLYNDHNKLNYYNYFNINFDSIMVMQNIIVIIYSACVQYYGKQLDIIIDSVSRDGPL